MMVEVASGECSLAPEFKSATFSLNLDRWRDSFSILVRNSGNHPLKLHFHPLEWKRSGKRTKRERSGFCCSEGPYIFHLQPAQAASYNYLVELRSKARHGAGICCDDMVLDGIVRLQVMEMHPTWGEYCKESHDLAFAFHLWECVPEKFEVVGRWDQATTGNLDESDELLEEAISVALPFLCDSI
jgi:hypothetical protein